MGLVAGARTPRLCYRFLRTGRCAAAGKPGGCAKVHNRSKVATCTKWLAGRCKKGDDQCPLTHRVEPEKMPMCSYFLHGMCAEKNCPYLHVNADPTQPVCQAFLRGHCPRGLQCLLRHTLVGPGGLCHFKLLA